VFLGALAGYERMDLQAGLVVCGQILLLVLAITLVPRHGLEGLAYAQIMQALFMLCTSRLLLCGVLPILPRIPRAWSKGAFKELLGYGANVQAASIAMMFFDTTTKLMLARFGGATAVGYFEVVNQLIMKIRAVIVTANQAIVPHVAVLAEREPRNLRRFYRTNVNMLVLFACPIFTLLVSWAGAFSWLLIGEYQIQFITLLWVVGSAWFFNIFSAPAYFMNMGTGNVKWNTLAHISMALVNAGIGWALGPQFGTLGIAFSYATSLATGAALVLYSTKRMPDHQNSSTTSVSHGCNQSHAPLLLGCLVVILLSWWTPLHIEDSTYSNVFLGMFVPPVLLATLMWVHPLRKEVINLVKSIAVRSE
jgi:O-antigen/teichoic acid export membrane protein